MFIKLLKDVEIYISSQTSLKLAKGSYLDHVKMLNDNPDNKSSNQVEYQYGLFIVTFWIWNNDYEIINKEDIPIP